MKNSLRLRTAIIISTIAIVPLAAAVAQAGSSPLVTAVQALDRDTDGFIDRIDVRFNQAMQTQTPEAAAESGAPGFWIPGYSIVGFEWGNPAVVLGINVAEGTAYDTAATPTVFYTPGAGTRDLKTSVGVPLEEWDTVATDAAGAVLVSVTAKDFGATNLFAHVGDAMTLRFTEPVSIVGTTPADRWASLERAVTFSLVAGGAACQDGVGVITDRNFPRPQTATDDPIASPAPGERSDTVHVRFVAGNQGSSNDYMLPGIPAGCKVGIHGTHNSAILDAASNPAAPLTTDARRRFIYPEDAQVASAQTADGVSGAADGLADAVRLTFDLPIDDATVGAHLGDFTAGGQIASWDTGTTANDTAITLVLTIQQPGGVTPQVAYTRHASCGSTSSGSVGTGVKSLIFPLGSAHRACVGTIAATAADGVAPRIVSARTLDTDGNGLIDAADVTFTEPVTTGGIDGWAVGGAPVTEFTPNGTTARLTFAEAAWTTGDTPNVAYLVPPANPVADAAGNGLAERTVTPSDGASPRPAGVTVHDADLDGDVDSATFTFNEAITHTAAAENAFSLAGVNGSSVLSHAGSSITISFEGITGTGARAAAFSPTAAIRDASGNEALGAAFAAAAVVDDAAPIGSVQIAPNAPVGPGTTTISGVFTESMDTAIIPTVTFAGRAVTPLGGATHTGGWKNSDPTVWEGTIEVAGSDCDVATGCEVSAEITGAHDLRGNAAGQASRTTEIDTIAPEVPAAFTFDAGGAPAGYANAASSQLSLVFEVSPGDAEDGTVRLLIDGAPSGDPVAIGAGSEVTLTRDFGSAEALRSEITEGAHTIGATICDDAQNCTIIADGASFTADFTPVEVDLTSGFDQTFSGGDEAEIAWEGSDADPDFSGVTLSYSPNGSAWQTISDGHAAAGSTSWTVPVADTHSARIRVSSVDAAGNTHSATSPAFTIDSSAPVVTLTAPASGAPFLGDATTVRWSATDVSDTEVQIEYTTDGGSNWAPINGGSYSQANDGIESWTVPQVKSFDTKVRVTATDATGRSTQVSSARLATGVRGFVADRGGTVYGFGASSTVVRETLISRSDVVRGLAVRSDDRSGYVLSYDGRVYPFAESGTALPPYRSATRLAAKNARGLVLQTDVRGYVVDSYGRIYPFGGAPRVTPSKTWVGSDLARGIVMRSDKRGGYVLDAYGRLHPFKLSTYPMPPQIQTRTISSKRAVSVVLGSNQRSGYVLEHTGRLLRFGGAAKIANPGVSSSAGARSLIQITPGGGYWADGSGTLKPYGDAFGSPTKARLRPGRARGAGS